MSKPRAHRLRLWVEHPPTAVAAGSASACIGAELRRRREALGLDLDDVAAAIRIPPRHIESIETARHKALPARIYAIGFVRSYADYLGMDARAAVERFKKEALELAARPVLLFPEPATERRVPGGALVAVSVCAALAVYVVWYMQTAQHWAHGDRVPVAPIEIAQDDSPPATERRVADLAPGLGGRSEFVPPSDQSAARTLAVATAPADQALGVWRPVPLNGVSAPATTVANAPVPSGPPLPRARPDPSRPAPSPSVQDPSGAPGDTRHASAGSVSPGQYATVPAVTIEPRGTEVAQATRSVLAGSGAVVRPDRIAEGSSWMPVMRQPNPVEVASPGTPSPSSASPGVAWAQMPSVATGPVVLRAAEASWIEVRAETGEVVHAKLMKAGDSYEVPQRAGLRLTTGNAGGLDVTVGGEVTPKLGARGAVIREIPLEGPRLLSGTATRN